MSAVRLSTTYSVAISMASACTTGRSRLLTPSTKRPADAGEVEHVLDHDHPAGQVGQVDGDHLERRPERVGERVADDDGVLVESFQPGHLDVVRLEHLDHRRPHDPRHVGRDRDHQGDDRQHHAAEVIPGTASRRDLGHGRQHLKHDCREDHHQAHPHHELGQRGQQQRQDRGRHVERLVTPHRRVGADPDRQRYRDDPAQEHQEGRVDEQRPQVCRHRLLGRQRVAHVSVQEPGHPVPVLLQHRLIEVELRAQRGQAGGRGVAAEDRPGGIPRQRLSGGEHQHRDDHQHQQAQQHAAKDEPPDTAGLHAQPPPCGIGTASAEPDGGVPIPERVEVERALAGLEALHLG